MKNITEVLILNLILAIVIIIGLSVTVGEGILSLPKSILEAFGKREFDPFVLFLILFLQAYILSFFFSPLILVQIEKIRTNTRKGFFR